MSKIKLLALFGESGVGKDTIQHWLVNNLPNTHKIISCTTRPPRDYEKNGIDYYFLNANTFISKYLKNEILEFTIFNDWYYGTLKSDLKKDKINIGVFNIEGIHDLLEYFNELEILPVRIQVDEKTRLLRSLNREKNPNCEEICRRFLTDKKDFKNINFNYEIFLNDKDKDDYYGLLKRPKVEQFLKGQI